MNRYSLNAARMAVMFFLLCGVLQAALSAESTSTPVTPTVSATEVKELRLPHIFSKGMVLQREMPVPIWGWAPAGTTVQVEFAGQKTQATADASGKWRVTLDPLKACNDGRELKVTSTRNQQPSILRVQDVLVGEVWFTAGQSNMMMALGSATGGREFFEQHHGEYGGRLRVVSSAGPNLLAEQPRDDVAARWSQPNISYSAVSYWFAHKLFWHFNGEVPIGMITYPIIVPAEAWVDRPALEKDPRLKPVLNDALQYDAKAYNGVICAIAPYTIRGVVYYQGEYNGGRGLQFRALMPALIRSWRAAWQQPDLPFLFVQLPKICLCKIHQARNLVYYLR